MFELAIACFVICFCVSSLDSRVLEGPVAPNIVLPNKSTSVRFAAFGDMGTGERAQYETGREMVIARDKFNFTFALMLGDNIYGGKSQKDFKRKFEDVYRPLLDSGVKFYAALGNHDDPNERLYKPFNMNGKRYYKLNFNGVDFYALDSTYMDRPQLDWFRENYPPHQPAGKSVSFTIRCIRTQDFTARIRICACSLSPFSRSTESASCFRVMSTCMNGSNRIRAYTTSSQGAADSCERMI